MVCSIFTTSEVIGNLPQVSVIMLTCGC